MTRYGLMLPIFRILILIVSALIHTQNPAMAQPINLDASKPVRVGSDHDYPPYEFNDTLGHPTGFNVELIQAVMNVSGLKANIRLGVWSEIRDDLEQGTIDVIAGMYYSSEREKTVDFSVPHNRVSSALFVKTDSPIKSFDQITGKSLVVQRGDIMHDYLVEHGMAAHLTVVDDPIQALRLLESGKHDGVLMSSKIQGLYFIHTYGIKGMRTVETGLPPRNYCFAVKKNNADLLQRLNEGLNILKQTGHYRTLYEKWFGIYETRNHWETYRALIITLIAILALLAVISAISWILRIQVKRRTRELSLSERRYRHLVQNASDILYVTDEKGYILYINPIAESILGYSADEMKGQRIFDYIAPKYRQEIINLSQNQYSLKIPTTYHEFPLISKDSKEVWIGQNSRLLEQNNNVIGFQAMARDITERKKIEEDRERLRERLQRAEKMEALGTLAGGVAHDLNNVLGILVGYSELLLDDTPQDNPMRNHVEKIMQGGVRAAAIVQDLLTLARRGVQSEGVVSLNALIRDFLNTPECENIQALYPNIQIETELSPDLLNIKGSTPHLFKTVLNLLTNAAESISGGGRISVKTVNRSLDTPIQGYDTVRVGDYAVLSISDTGEGIPDTDIGHIFEPFYTKKIMGRSGTGLGLAVVWGTVKDHQGYIDVHSEPGKGTVFSLYFPVTREQLPPSSTPTPLVDYMGNKESILVVDDISEQQEMAARMLGKLNYSVETASSGEAAVGILESRTFDLVILDMLMPGGMDGLETYRQILAIHPGQKVIIVSGYSSTDRVREAQALGAGSYVKKPYILETLGLAVKMELARTR